MSYNPTTGVTFEGQLTPSSLQFEEDTPLLDEDEDCDEEAKPIKVRMTICPRAKTASLKC